MTRLTAGFTTLAVVLVLVGGAFAGLASADKTKLRRWMTAYLDPSEDDDTRQKALASIREFFQDRKRANSLGDVEDLRELLRVSSKRSRPKRSGAVLERELEIQGHKFQHAISIPKKYTGAEGDDPYPLIVCLPDRGEDSKEYLDKYWGDPKIREGYLIAVLDYSYEDVEVERTKQVTDEETSQIRFEKVKEMVPFDWAAPDSYDRFWLTLVGMMLKEYKIDPDRIILDGAGMGASGAILAAAGTTWRFAGLVLRGGVLDSPMLANLVHLSVLSLPLDGAGDDVQKTAEEMKTLLGDGLEVGSGAEWAATGEEGAGGALTKWLDGCVRKRYPLPSKWTSVSKVYQFGYWFFITKTFDGAMPATLAISSDRKTNKIEVDAANVKEFTLFLNDVLIDMDEPFELFVNGEKVIEDQKARDVGQLLSHALIGSEEGRAPNDPGCVFLNEITDIQVKAPPPPQKKPEEEEKEAEGEGEKKEGEGEGEKKEGEGEKPAGGEKEG